jgi:hypothetical protein
MMVVGILIGLAIGVGVGTGIGLWHRRVVYRTRWMQNGREDALLPYPYRYTPQALWLRRYYDEGYEQGLREKEHK